MGERGLLSRAERCVSLSCVQRKYGAGPESRKAYGFLAHDRNAPARSIDRQKQNSQALWEKLRERMAYGAAGAGKRKPDYW